MSASDAKMRVLVADSAPTRFGVRLALDGVATICAEAGTRRQAVELAQELQPDVCLLGRALPGGCIEAVREITDSLPQTAVIVLAHDDHSNDLLAAVRAGATGYVPAGFEAEQLRRVILAVKTAEPAIPRSMVRELVDEIRESERAGEGGLSLRESQVLAMLRRGKPTAMIADTLDISPVTVRRHISVLVRKAGVSSRAELLLGSADPDARRAG